MTGNVTYLADHTLLLALPALVPALMVAGVVLYVSVRDRRRGASETCDDER